MKTPSRALLDLRGLVIHAYYSGEPTATVVNKEGKAVAAAAHAVYEFIRQYLEPILMQYAPIDIIAVNEGAKHNTRRRDIFPEYKAKAEQDSQDEVVSEQKKEALALVNRLLLGLGSVLVACPTVEADDMLGLLMQKLHGGKVVYTVDNDILQGGDDRTAFFVKTELRDFWKCGKLIIPFDEIPSRKLITLAKSILGDSSDGYPGVKGCGEKAWEYLVQTYGYQWMMDHLVTTVETASWERLLPLVGADKVLGKIYEQRDQWRMCWKLAELHPEWCERSRSENVVAPKWEKRLPNRERVLAVLEPLGLESLMPIFDPFFPTQTLITRDNANLINAGMFAEMRESPFLPFDYESFDELKHEDYSKATTRGDYVDVLNQRITGASFCYGTNMQHSIYISVNHRDTANLPADFLIDVFGGVFDGTEAMNGPLDLVAHNNKFEQVVTLKNLGIQFDYVLDTYVMASHVNENDDGYLKWLSKKWLNYDQTEYNEVVPDGSDMRDVSGQEVLGYGCDDSFTCGHLTALFRVIMEVEGSWSFFVENEPYFDVATLPSFVKGIPMDWDRLAKLRSEDEQLAVETEARVRALLTEHCSNINEEGFKILWPEIEQFERAKMLDKNDKIENGGKGTSKSEAEIEARLEEIKAVVHAACRYVPKTPRAIAIDKTSLSAVARALGLAGIRSLKHAWIERYVESMAQQARAQNAELTPRQNDFLVLLSLAAPALDSKAQMSLDFESASAVGNLFELMQLVVESEDSMWDGDELNVDSPKQMAELFYGKCALPIAMRNFQQNEGSVRSVWDLEGAPSTNENAIRTWMTMHQKGTWQFELLEAILTLRGCRQRNKLYYKPYPYWKSPLDGRIHPQLKNCGTITRRPSGSSPNILQVSKIKDDGRLRSCFLPQDDDSVIVSIDFVQQELVILAALSQDKNLLSCYVGNNRKDVHTLTGASIYNMLEMQKGNKPISYERFVELLKAEDKQAVTCRKKYAKTTNFLIVYGGSAGGLSRKVIVPYEMAEKFVQGFNTAYPRVLKFQERTIDFARKHGYVLTLCGNRKHCRGIFDKNPQKRSAWERQAINAPIQGTAADIAKIVCREYVMQRIEEITGATMYAFVYDEIVASVPKAKVHQFVESLANIMELELVPGVRLRTSVSIGENWGDQVELGERPSYDMVQLGLRHIAEGHDELSPRHDCELCRDLYKKELAQMEAV